MNSLVSDWLYLRSTPHRGKVAVVLPDSGERITYQELAEIVDRIADLVTTGGEDVYPAEVENVLYNHPAVREAAVVGMPDEHMGEAVVAVLVLAPTTSTTTDELSRLCSERLPAHKVPRRFEIWPELPKNASGGIPRAAVRRQLGSLDPRRDERS